MRFDELNENNYMLFAIKFYDNPHALTKEEFEDDLKRIKYVKRLLKRYKNTGVLNTDSLLPTEFSNSVAGLGLLLDTDYNLASDESDSVYFLQPYEFAAPVTVNSETTSMNYKFSTDQAHRIWYMTAGAPNIVVLMSYLGDFNLVVEAE